MKKTTTKKPGPIPRPRSEIAKVRGITASDQEWSWVLSEAKKNKMTASSFVRSLIQQAMQAAE